VARFLRDESIALKLRDSPDAEAIYTVLTMSTPGN